MLKVFGVLIKFLNTIFVFQVKPQISQIFTFIFHVFMHVVETSVIAIAAGVKRHFFKIFIYEYFT